MGKRPLRQYLPVLIVIVVWFAASGFLVYYSPEGLIELIGVENAYVFLLLFAFASGVSFFGGVPYHMMLIALAAAGLDPWLLGLSATVGVMLGDSTSYAIGYHGRALVPVHLEKPIHAISSWLGRRPRFAPLFFLLYGSLVPFSNDFVGVITGLARYPFLRVIVPLACGNLIFNTTLAFLTPYLHDTLQLIFS